MSNQKKKFADETESPDDTEAGVDFGIILHNSEKPLRPRPTDFLAFIAESHFKHMMVGIRSGKEPFTQLVKVVLRKLA